jgi:hypothetical protein
MANLGQSNKTKDAQRPMSRREPRMLAGSGLNATGVGAGDFRAFISQDRYHRQLVYPKEYPNRAMYLQVLRQMTPAQRLAKAMELSELGKRLFLHGLRRRFPELDERELHAIYLKRIAQCHNRNY